MLESEYRQLIRKEAIDASKHCLISAAILKIWHAAVDQDDHLNASTPQRVESTFEEEAAFWRAFAQENKSFAHIYFQIMMRTTIKGLIGEDPTQVERIIFATFDEPSAAPATMS